MFEYGLLSLFERYIKKIHELKVKFNSIKKKGNDELEIYRKFNLIYV